MHFVVSIISHAISHRAYTMGPMEAFEPKRGSLAHTVICLYDSEPIGLVLMGSVNSSDSCLSLREINKSNPVLKHDAGRKRKDLGMKMQNRNRIISPQPNMGSASVMAR